MRKQGEKVLAEEVEMVRLEADCRSDSLCATGAEEVAAVDCCSLMVPEEEANRKVVPLAEMHNLKCNSKWKGAAALH